MYTQLQYVGKNLYVIFQEPYLTLDVAFYFSKLPEVQDGETLPGWTGFNCILQSSESKVPQKSKVSFRV